MVPKRECPALQSSSAGTGLERPEEPHLEMQQTVMISFALANCTRISKQRGGDFSFQADFGVNSKRTSQVTARQVFSNFADELARARDDCIEYRAKQAV